MKKKIRISLLVFVGLILIHDLGLLPISADVFSINVKDFSDTNEIQKGALAGNEVIQYQFVFKDGSTKEVQKGTRIINLVEKEPLKLGIGSIFPFYRVMYPETVFQCYEEKNKRYLGLIRIKKRVNTAGLLNRKKLKKILFDLYQEEILQYLGASTIFIDQTGTGQESGISFTWSTSGGAKTTVNLA